LVRRLKNALGTQLDVLEKGLEMYRKFGSSQTKDHVDHLFMMYQNMKQQLSKHLTK
jgi:hypothetical protein